jgi:hypothetical protein
MRSWGKYKQLSHGCVYVCICVYRLIYSEKCVFVCSLYISPPLDPFQSELACGRGPHRGGSGHLKISPPPPNFFFWKTSKTVSCLMRTKPFFLAYGGFFALDKV